MPKPIQLSCVGCGHVVVSDADGSVCEECGAARHSACPPKNSAVQDHRCCETCGGLLDENRAPVAVPPVMEGREEVLLGYRLLKLAATGLCILGLGIYLTVDPNMDGRIVAGENRLIGLGPLVVGVALVGLAVFAWKANRE